MVCAAVVLGVAVLAGADTRASRPDIILILTDDQRADTLEYMPLTRSLIGDAGVDFTHALVSDPLCCPSRASILTGLYTHNHGVFSNDPPQGGAPKFVDTSTIATWLQAAGYRTSYIGKYMNAYAPYTLMPWPYTPPGWDDWHAMRQGGDEDGGEKEDDPGDPRRNTGTAGYFTYTLVENGREVRYGPSNDVYSTDVLASKAVEFIEAATSKEPFFLVLGTKAPHFPALPAPDDRGRFHDLPPWRPPSYNEEDVSDKPAWVRALPPLSPKQQAFVDGFRRNQLETLLAVDRAVASLVDALARTQRLVNAAIIFTSDNGHTWGEHRWVGKKCVYEECVKVPLLVRAPGAVVRRDSQLVMNIDLAPTIAEWADVVPPRKVNGKSFAALLMDPGARWRRAALLEHLITAQAFTAVHTSRYVYAEYVNGDREFYDLKRDPYQLESRVNDPAYAAKIAQLKATLEVLREK